MRQPDIEVVLQKIGAIRLTAGDRDGALEAYEEALEIAERMAQAFPDKEVWQQDVAETQETIKVLKQPPDDTAER